MYRSGDYLEFVRGCRCIALGCSRNADVAHHFSKRHGDGGEALKPHDTFTVPLCNDHHLFIHNKNTLPAMNHNETESYLFRIALQLVTRWMLLRERWAH